MQKCMTGSICFTCYFITLMGSVFFYNIYNGKKTDTVYSTKGNTETTYTDATNLD